jgi:hypothetical protein
VGGADAGSILQKPDLLKSDRGLETMREKPWFKKILGE